ncbi:MAG: monooxygenase [Candidatus Dormibacteraeota bacterium]|nr:monooxygenase [Candidatus Dormibacteraeota bacterium]
MTVTVDRGVNLAITVEATELPSRSCAPADAGHAYTNVHVGLCDRSFKDAPIVTPSRPWGVVGVVPGDAESARWDIEVTARVKADDVDFGGRFVRGNRGDRHIGLAWGELIDSQKFALFRGARLKLESINPVLLAEAMEPGRRLVARLGLTDSRGNPRCATVKPPDLVWTVAVTGRTE